MAESSIPVLTAERLELYNPESKKSVMAAHAIDNKFAAEIEGARKAISEGEDLMKAAKSVRDKVYKVMDEYGDCGAGDTEPECALVEAIESALAMRKYSLGR